MLDPYLKWLGIRDAERPPNHYRLLGIEMFESDPDVICAAADRQMGHLRKYQSGEHAAFSQCILNQIATAKLCLLDAEKRAAYDAEIRKKAALAPNRSAPGYAGSVMPDRRAPIRRKKWHVARRVAYLLAIVALGTGVFAARHRIEPLWAKISAKIARRPVKDKLAEPATTGDQRPASTSASTSAPTAAPTRSPDDRSTARRGPTETLTRPGANAGSVNEDQPVDAAAVPPTADQPTESAPWDALPTAKPPAQERPNEALAALGRRDIDAAIQKLTRLRKLSQTPQDRQRVAMISLAIDQVSLVLAKAAANLKSLEAGQTLRYGEQDVSVRQVDGTTIELESATGIRKTFSRELVGLPAEFVIALANVGAHRSQPVWDVAVATFLSVDNTGDTTRANRLASLASQQGIPTQLVTFLNENDGAAGEEVGIPVAVADAEIVPTEAVVANTTVVADAADEHRAIVEDDSRLTVPSDEQIAASLKLVRQLFTKQLKKTSDENRLRLANQMLAQGRKTRDDRTARWVLLNEALRLGQVVGDVDTAWQCVDEISASFRVDGDQERSQLILDISRRSDDAESMQRLIELGLSAIDAAVARDDYAAAEKLAHALSSPARRTKDNYLAKRLQQLQADLKVISTSYTKLTPALRRLDVEPADPIASAKVGMFLALEKGNFDDGLPLLAQSNHPMLRTLAKQELDPTLDRDGRLTLADRWWDYAAELKGLPARNAKRHAVGYYRDVMPGLDGETKTRVHSRIQAFDAAGQTARAGQLAEILASEWKVIWNNRITWDRLAFVRTGKALVFARGKDWPNRWYATPDAIQVVSQNGEFRYVLRLAESGQLRCAKYDAKTSQLLVIGVGERIGQK